MDSSELAVRSPADLAAKPLAERELALWIASGEYMRGNLTKEQLEVKERLYAPNLYSFDSPLPQTAPEISPGGPGAGQPDSPLSLSTDPSSRYARGGLLVIACVFLLIIIAAISLAITTLH